MKIQSSNYPSIEQLQDQYLNTSKSTATAATEGMSFKDILSGKVQSGAEIKFSKHASNRLADRNIELTDAQMERLNEGTQKASQKGIKDSLVIMDKLAFIVNIPSSTVITAMVQTETDENVFTNIDGAVIV